MMVRMPDRHLFINVDDVSVNGAVERHALG
jgi:hypothetical protein